MNKLPKLTKEEVIALKKELKEISKELAGIVEATIGKDQTKQEENLWARKREILAELNPVNQQQ